MSSSLVPKTRDGLSPLNRAQTSVSRSHLQSDGATTGQDGITEFQDSSFQIVRKGIIELYLNVKIRSAEEIKKITEDQIQKERNKLSRVDSLDILDYVKQSVEILMHMRAEEFQLFKDNWEAQERLRSQKEKAQQSQKGQKKMKTPKNSRIYKKMSDVTAAAGNTRDTDDGDKDNDTSEVPVEYETWIQKLEQDVRKHIRIEQQLKLHVEQMQSQIDEAYKESLKQQQLAENELKKIRKEMHTKELENKELFQKFEQQQQPLLEKSQQIQELEKGINDLKVDHSREITALQNQISKQKSRFKLKSKPGQNQIELDVKDPHDQIHSELVTKQDVKNAQNYGMNPMLSTSSNKLIQQQDQDIFSQSLPPTHFQSNRTHDSGKIDKQQQIVVHSQNINKKDMNMTSKSYQKGVIESSQASTGTHTQGSRVNKKKKNSVTGKDFKDSSSFRRKTPSSGNGMVPNSQKVHNTESNQISDTQNSVHNAMAIDESNLQNYQQFLDQGVDMNINQIFYNQQTKDKPNSNFGSFRPTKNNMDMNKILKNQGTKNPIPATHLRSQSQSMNQNSLIMVNSKNIGGKKKGISTGHQTSLARNQNSVEKKDNSSTFNRIRMSQDNQKFPKGVRLTNNSPMLMQQKVNIPPRAYSPDTLGMAQNQNYLLFDTQNNEVQQLISQSQLNSQESVKQNHDRQSGSNQSQNSNYKNKIIINQQSYFTDSIKINQVNSNVIIRQGKPNMQHQGSGGGALPAHAAKRQMAMTSMGIAPSSKQNNVIIAPNNFPINNQGAFKNINKTGRHSSCEVDISAESIMQMRGQGQSHMNNQKIPPQGNVQSNDGSQKIKVGKGTNLVSIGHVSQSERQKVENIKKMIAMQRK